MVSGLDGARIGTDLRKRLLGYRQIQRLDLRLCWDRYTIRTHLAEIRPTCPRTL